ncbi:uncharacterized protein LOC128454669 [Pleuronectes platessa]|uniref:uncharacterized protein LOC128454669 n=1 Tax=Pleuronectes platessa TaxID=8262 RepID=UPI00232A2307|nr:uncharacterized protein LOC128454669 [Pleuronectes platessa]
MSSVFRSAWKWGTSVFFKPKSNDPEETSHVFDSVVNIPSNDCIPETPERSQRLADAVRDESKLLKPQSGSLPVYKIPLKEEDITVNGCKRFHFGKESHERNRTIMVLGATGAGKSTLINGMINYVLGVEWNDPYRFKLVDEGQSTSQAHSQTTEVTVYKLNRRDGFNIPNSLTIVDTPGFGDTRGIEKDKLIVEQLRKLFSAEGGVSEIDAVCFVAQASLARLTPTQKYVFDSVLSIFGKDVAENIRVLVTFADGQRPPVLEAINEADVPCPKNKEGLPVHFKFNNSALFAQNKSCAAESASEEDDEGDFDKMFWNMGIRSMRKFFTALNVITTKSLTMTKDVLRERQQLEVSVQNLQKQVKIGLNKLEELKETASQLRDHEAEISRNKDFVIISKVMKAFQYDNSGSGSYITNCQQCNFTCHDDCVYANDADKIRCCAMGSDGYCTQCPGRCVWSIHFNQKYKWEYKEVIERTTVKELEEKYLKASEAATPVKSLIDKLRAEYDLVQAEVVKVMGDSTKCLNRLKEIALRPNPLSTPEYIDMLIEGEKAEAKSGWKKRVQYLMDMREKAEFMAKVDRGEEFLQSSSSDFQSFLQGPTKDSADKDTTDNTNEKGDAEQDQDEKDENQDEKDGDQDDKDGDQDEKDEDQDEKDGDQDEKDEDQDENDGDQDENDRDQDEKDEDQDEKDQDQVNTEDQDQDEDQELDSNQSFEDQDPDSDSINDQEEKDSDFNQDQDVARTATETD